MLLVLLFFSLLWQTNHSDCHTEMPTVRLASLQQTVLSDAPFFYPFNISLTNPLYSQMEENKKDRAARIYSFKLLWKTVELDKVDRPSLSCRQCLLLKMELNC